MLRNIADNWIVVPIGERVVDFNGLITLSDTGAFLWKMLLDSSDNKALIAGLLSEYEIDETTAIIDVEEFIYSLQERNLVENE